MARMLVVDPLLLTDEFGVGEGWVGAEHEIVIPDGFAHEELASADVVLTAHYPVTAATIEAAPNLRLIASPAPASTTSTSPRRRPAGCSSRT